MIRGRSPPRVHFLCEFSQSLPTQPHVHHTQQRYTDPNLRRAEIDQRTSAGRFRKVMWYCHELGYGNDILGHPVESWKTSHEAELMAFISRLVPSHC